MDVDDVFNLFESGQDKPSSEKGVSSTERPDVFIPLFTKLVLSVDTLNNSMSTVLSKLDPSLDIEKLKHANKLLTIAKAYDYIAQFDLKNPAHIEALFEADMDLFIEACEEILNILTRYEEYEKCAFIKELKDFAKFSQNKLPL
jgi:hypothetical protein